MKYFFIWVLTAVQWNTFGSDCGFTFVDNNKDPSDILEHITAIHQMSAKKAVLCFNELKSVLIDTEPQTNISGSNKQSIDFAYENHRQENMARIQHLMPLVIENQNEIQKMTPPLHPEISKYNMFGIQTTFTQMSQTNFIAGKPVFSETPSDLERQVEQLQPQKQNPMLWNPYLHLPWMLPQRDTFLDKLVQEPIQDTEQTAHSFQPIKEKDLRLYQSGNQQYFWTENIHIEFPSVILCRKPADELSQAFFTTFKDHAKELVDFTNKFMEIRNIYEHIMEWLDSVKNQEGQNLPNIHPLFNFAVYNIQWNQMPDFILNSMTDEQKEKLTHIINLSRKYSWMYNLHFEYRKCLPKVFREHLLISYSAPTPLQTTDSSKPFPQIEKLSNIDILYEFSIHTPPFASSFKQSYPIRILQQSYAKGDDFTSNDLKNRYEPEWSETLQFLRQFILKNRAYLDVSL